LILRDSRLTFRVSQPIISLPIHQSCAADLRIAHDDEVVADPDLAAQEFGTHVPHEHQITVRMVDIQRGKDVAISVPWREASDRRKMSTSSAGLAVEGFAAMLRTGPLRREVH
jgi:hypothetical protein